MVRCTPLLLNTTHSVSFYKNTAVHDLELPQLDVKTAFLNGDFEEELFMDQTVRFKRDDQSVCLLKTSLYGLKQASRAWKQKFNQFFIMLLSGSSHT